MCLIVFSNISVTLVYGSCDATMTIHNEKHTQFELAQEIMTQLGFALALEEHQVTEHSTQKEKSVWGPVDMEVGIQQLIFNS